MIFNLYDWTSNAILATPVANVKDTSIVEAFKASIEYLTKRGLEPSFNIINNVASKTIQKCLEDNDIKIQLIEPHNHCVNTARQSIQTFKNHLIAGFCTIDRDCLAAIWSKFIPQAQDSLNMLRTSRIHPKVSVFNPPETRTSWGTRALDAFYVSPAPQHYIDAGNSLSHPQEA
jgi:hypothetical protein